MDASETFVASLTDPDLRKLKMAVWERLSRSYEDFPTAQENNWTIPEAVAHFKDNSNEFRTILSMMLEQRFDLALLEYHKARYPMETQPLTPQLPVFGPSYSPILRAHIRGILYKH